MSRTQLLCFAMALLALPSLALADSFGPPSFSTTLPLNGSDSVTKELTVTSAGAVDILFLFDTTGSNVSRYTFDNALTNDPTKFTWADVAQEMLDKAQTKFSAADASSALRFAIAKYEDFPPPTGVDSAQWQFGAPGDTAFQLLQDFTTSEATAFTSMTSGLATGGTGNDTDEAAIHALGRSAQDASWNANATKIVVWLGDSPGHEPTDTNILGMLYPGAFSTSTAIDALNLEDIMVEVFNFGTMNGRGGQATAIANATGGDYWDVSSGQDYNKLVAFRSAYEDALDAASAYTVSLDTSNLPSDLSLAGATVTYSGDRTTIQGSSQTYQWVLTFTGDNYGDWTFDIYGMLDGKIVGTETDHIRVTRGTTPNGEVPEPTTVALLGLGLLGLGVAARRRIKK